MISYKRSHQILKKAPIKIGDEIINCENALNRVLSLNIFSNYNYPAANNAAFDGFAVNSKDTKFLNKNSPQKFRIIGSMIAGTKPITKKIKKFETVEIMTGGIVPKGFDTIIPIKNIPAWKVRNSNGPYIKSLNENFLFNFINGGILRDNHASIFKNQINKMLKSNIDIIITSGAISAGKFDFIPSIVKTFKLSNYFKGVEIKPGKPVLFAKIKDKAIFGLPGNPISTAACYRFFVNPYLLNILGVETERPIKAILKNTYFKKKNMTHFVKAKYIFLCI
ncbi:MAG: hypothetical protein EBX73_03160 [Candidatus Fonsibacter ubiquis]|nr:hypothetical protein [Candidatus Fonsibacter ubiquis]